MLRSIGDFVGSRLGAGWDAIYWLMMEMDVIQWGIVSVVFVAAGFMALRTRL